MQVIAYVAKMADSCIFGTINTYGLYFRRPCDKLLNVPDVSIMDMKSRLHKSTEIYIVNIHNLRSLLSTVKL